ncbi:MAG: hypothetical protein GW836_07935 [Paraglaciecola sp.]|nr:hypothetical protein [Paraglaciecola sp.]
MKNAILATWRADFTRRQRNSSFIVTLLCMMVLAMIYFPAIDAAYQTVSVNGYRGIYNSAWVGTTLALLDVSFLPLICFYLIKGSIEFDRNSHSSELIAATSVSKVAYILGKFLSNFSVLLCILGSMLLTAICIQLWHAEDSTLELSHFILPQLLFVVPTLLLVAALALIFDSVKWLSGGVGNVLYFFLFMGSLVGLSLSDWGTQQILMQMQDGLSALGVAAEGHFRIGFGPNDAAVAGAIKIFRWQGMNYATVNWWPSFTIVALSLLLLSLAMVLFDRFKRPASQVRKANQSKLDSLIAIGFAPLNLLFDGLTRTFAFTRLVRLEVMLLLKGWPNGWYLLVLTLVIAQCLVEPEWVSGAILPAAWLLCVVVLSPLGQREARSFTSALVFSTSLAHYRQFLAMFFAGVLVLLFVSSGALLRFALTQQYFAIGLLVSGACAVVALAIVLGVLTKTPRTFEIVFTLLWYMGPLNKLVYLDFIGVDVVASEHVNATLIFSLSTLMLLALAAYPRLHRAN